MNSKKNTQVSKKSNDKNKQKEKLTVNLERPSTSKGQTSSDTVSRWSHISLDSDLSDLEQSKNSFKELKHKVTPPNDEEPPPTERQLFEAQRGVIDIQDSDSSISDAPQISYDFLEGKKLETSLPESLNLSDADEGLVQPQATQEDVKKPPL